MVKPRIGTFLCIRSRYKSSLWYLYIFVLSSEYVVLTLYLFELVKILILCMIHKGDNVMEEFIFIKVIECLYVSSFII